MTIEEKISAIREEVCRVNPEIKELKFGCEIKRSGSDRPYKVIEDIGWGANPKKVWVNSVAFGSMPLELEKDLIQKGGEFEIIGRKIGIQDVLLAMQSKSVIGEYSVDAYGYFRQKESHSPIKASWNLLKTLEDQDPPTIDFIHQVLKGV